MDGCPAKAATYIGAPRVSGEYRRGNGVTDGLEAAGKPPVGGALTAWGGVTSVPVHQE